MPLRCQACTLVHTRVSARNVLADEESFELYCSLLDAALRAPDLGEKNAHRPSISIRLDRYFGGSCYSSGSFPLDRTGSQLGWFRSLFDFDRLLRDPKDLEAPL